MTDERTGEQGEPRPLPPSPEQAPGLLLLGIGRAMDALLEAELKPLGVTLRHVAALGHLTARPGISYSELARRSRVTPQSMQATLQQLEGLGAVERRSPAGRGRTADLHVTGHGGALVDRARVAMRRAEDRLLAPLPPDDRAQLIRLLVVLLPAALSAPTAPDADADRET